MSEEGPSNGFGPRHLRLSGTILERYDLFGSTAPQGTTGFDVVGSWGWSRVEVPGGLVNHPENQYVRTLTSTPSPPSYN